VPSPPSIEHLQVAPEQGNQECRGYPSVARIDGSKRGELCHQADGCSRAALW
jgi:hypothetical protein